MGDGMRRAATMAGMTLAGTALVLALLATVPAPAPAADKAAWIFRPGHVTKIDLHLPAASTSGTQGGPGRVCPRQVPDEAQQRQDLRAAAHRRAPQGLLPPRPLAGKSAFKIKFGEYVEDQRFQGLEEMTLNNMVQDPTMLRELLAYKAFRAAGLPAWRTGYSFLRIDGDAYGVYLNLEFPDEVLHRALVPDHRAPLRGRGGRPLPGAAPQFEADAGDEDDIQDLERLIAAVTAWKDLDAVADLAQMTRDWAVEKYIGHLGQLLRAAVSEQLLPPQRRRRAVHDAALGNRSDVDHRGRLTAIRAGSCSQLAAWRMPPAERCTATPSVTSGRRSAGRTSAAWRTAPPTSSRAWRRKDPKQEWSERQVRKWTKRLNRTWPTARATRPGCRRTRRRKRSRSAQICQIDWTRRHALCRKGSAPD